MHRINKYFRMRRIDIGGNAMTQVKYMTATGAEGLQNSGDLSFNTSRIGP